MDIKDTLTPYRSDNILLSDSNYYKFIFKKTEKICCVVFYILQHADKGQHSAVADTVRELAKHALDASLAALSCRWYAAHDELFAVLHALLALESNIRVAQATALVQETIADMLSLEIETVLRALRPYLEAEKKGIAGLASFVGEGAIPTVVGRASVSSHGVPQRQSKGQVNGQRVERRRTIKDTLSSKGQATIKDISSAMPEMSEKMLQRELTSMVHEGIVLTEGERRWRRYSLVQGS